jgi:hypothetical protein
MPLLVFKGCRDEECTGDKQYYYINKKLLEYVGMYKPGNWWVYESSNKLLKDSIYVQEYKERFGYYSSPCGYSQILQSIIITKYLLPDYNKAYLYLECTEKTSFFSIFENGYHNIGPDIQMKFDHFTDSFKISKNNPQLIDSLKINNKYYFNNIKTNNLDEDHNNYFYIFSKGTGLIQWFNGKDTFSLTNYYIQ